MNQTFLRVHPLHQWFVHHHHDNQWFHRGHTNQDMLVSVILSGFRDATDRRYLEARMIFRHRTLHPGGLDVDFGPLQSQLAL